MEPKLLVVADASASPLVLARYREFCRSLASFAGEPVTLALEAAEVIASTARTLGGSQPPEVIEPVSSAPMTAAPFIYREDGRPDWAAMWSTFCELALNGGPPHRGDDDPLEAVPDGLADGAPADVLWEMRRGIAETTGLYCKHYPPSWLGIMCESRKMAAWLCAAIILENVDAWCDETLLFVPAGPAFRLEHEVKSVITVVAKTFHYWQQHAGKNAVELPLLGWDTHFH
jgi:sirohydrochlorin cobaltochelatase